MTVSARTAEIVVGGKRVQFDALLRSLPTASAQYFAPIGVTLYGEAKRWVAENQFRNAGSNVMYVNDAGWAMVLDAMDNLYRTARDSTPAQVAFIPVLMLYQRMPEGYRGAGGSSLTAIVSGDESAEATINTVSSDVLQQAQDTAGTITAQPEGNTVVLPTPTVDMPVPSLAPPPIVAALESALRAQGVSGPIDWRCLDMLPNSTTEATAANIVAGPHGMQSAAFRACLERGGASFGMNPKLKMGGLVAAGLLGAFLLVKIAK